MRQQAIRESAIYEDYSVLKFVIKDTGIGIKEEFIPKIFDAFTQEDGKRSRYVFRWNDRITNA